MLRCYGEFIQIQRFWLRNLHTNHLSRTLWAKDQTNGSAVAVRGGEAVGPQGQVMGIDLVPGMVQETTAEIKRRNLSHVTMLLMDAERLMFPDACFDYVLCGFAIFLFPHLEQAVESRKVVPICFWQSLTKAYPTLPERKRYDLLQKLKCEIVATYDVMKERGVES